MSVEDAREAILAKSSWEEPITDEMLDRLILEVQAEMPCYQREFYFPRRVCKKDEAWSDWRCPSCTARQRLTGVTA